MKPFSKIAALLFILVAVLHMARLVKGAQLMIGSHQVPTWVSFLGIIVPGILSWGIWKESRT